MSYSEKELLPISAVTHYVHCPRRCALVHLEQVWRDNVLTAEGNVLHERAHSGVNESRNDTLVVRSLQIRSLRLGVFGIADIVEFHRSDDGGPIFGHRGKWLPFPIEYKRGASKDMLPYRVQLCVQAFCLEEMFRVQVLKGALYIGVEQHREAVDITDELRGQAIQYCKLLHEMMAKGETPRADFSKKCHSCSVFEICSPKMTTKGTSVLHWITRQITVGLT